MTNRQAIQKYSAATLPSGDPIKTVILLYDTLIRLLYKAKKAIDESNVILRHESIHQAAGVVDLLHNGLDLKNESKLIRLLDKFYTNLFIKINMLVIKNQGHEEIDEILQSVRSLRTKWIEFDQRNEEFHGPASNNNGGTFVSEEGNIETNVKC
jgi:flagellar protein FliS